MPRRKPLSDREMHVLASAIGVIESKRLRTRIANDVWTALREYDTALTDGPQWRAGTRCRAPISRLSFEVRVRTTQS
jgi:hypothetical protein